MCWKRLKKKSLIFEGEESNIILKENEYTGIVGVPLLIPVKVDKGSTLLVRTYQNSVLVSTDTIYADKRKLDLEVIPLPGRILIELEIDRQRWKYPQEQADSHRP